jgi:exodeoxyribonuclease VII large subunit
LFGPSGEDDRPGSESDEAPAAPVTASPRTWTVSQVNRAVRLLLEDTVEPLWISGEIANWTRARSGHCYFSLKDETSQLRCVMFRTEADQLPIDPDDGMTVRAFGGLTLYEARGDYQLVVRRLEAEGAEGLWRIAFEKLRGKLEGEGLLSAERKRSLPRFPTRIGVVTSPTGAAFRDIVHVIARRAPWTRLVLRGTRVQGEGAALEIADAIRTLGGSGMVDVMIVGRGGGSLEDLWAFNEEPVARAILDCPVPVISAVGHEVDVTIADLVADYRAPTPSAGAEAAVPDRETLEGGLAAAVGVLRRALSAVVVRDRQGLEQMGTRLARATENLIGPRRRSLAWGSERLNSSVGRFLTARRSRLEQISGKMDVLSPLSTLRRGYAIPLDGTGKLLRSIEAFARGTRFDLRVADGTVQAESKGTRGESGES